MYLPIAFTSGQSENYIKVKGKGTFEWMEKYNMDINLKYLESLMFHVDVYKDVCMFV